MLARYRPGVRGWAADCRDSKRELCRWLESLLSHLPNVHSTRQDTHPYVLRNRIHFRRQTNNTVVKMGCRRAGVFPRALTWGKITPTGRPQELIILQSNGKRGNCAMRVSCLHNSKADSGQHKSLHVAQKTTTKQKSARKSVVAPAKTKTKAVTNRKAE